MSEENKNLKVSDKWKSLSFEQREYVLDRKREILNNPNFKSIRLVIPIPPDRIPLDEILGDALAAPTPAVTTKRALFEAVKYSEKTVRYELIDIY